MTMMLIMMITYVCVYVCVRVCVCVCAGVCRYIAACRRAMDALFLLDCCDAEADEDAWNSTLHFVDEAVAGLRPRSGGTHVALALFSRDQSTVVIRKLEYQPLHAVV